MDPSKPPSDIGVPSKANSDIEERPKANSDIGITVSSILSSNIDFIKSDTTKVELESKSGKSDLESCHRSGSINVKLSNTESKHPALIEDAPLDAKALQKRGKLVHSCDSIDNNLPSYSFMSMNSFETVGKRSNFIKKRTNLFDLEKIKLQSKIQEYNVDQRIKISDDLNCSFKNWSIKPKVNFLKSESNHYKSQPKLKKSQSFACSNIVNSKAKQLIKKVYNCSDSKDILNQNSFKSQNRLIKMQTLVNLDNIEKNIENISESSVLENKFNFRLNKNNCIYSERCQSKELKHSLSFQIGYKLRETKIINNFEKPKLSNSRSFCTRKNVSELIDNKQPRLGNISTTKCYNGSISSSFDTDMFESSIIDNHKSNLSPPPLSNLQIFAISTKPLDISVTNIDVPNNIDKLPSLPIIHHNECKLESEKKLSILEPPPPGLVSREESTENWNRFLVQLNSILESRVGEFV